jgi:hypothetical protein
MSKVESMDGQGCPQPALLSMGNRCCTNSFHHGVVKAGNTKHNPWMSRVTSQSGTKKAPQFHPFGGFFADGACHFDNVRGDLLPPLPG